MENVVGKLCGTQSCRNNAYLTHNLDTYALVLDVVNLEVTFELMN
jgi:hypothetical protein